MKIAAIIKTGLLLIFGTALAGGGMYLALGGSGQDEQGLVTQPHSQAQTAEADSANVSARFKEKGTEEQRLPVQNPGAFLSDTGETAQGEQVRTAKPGPAVKSPPLADLQPHQEN
ncbi:MAG TPA: hypothetical protein ENJ57_03335 [Rhizobiales bacterium]|nr:hypothetical protein [Hyphomicrobiales bacterium]